MEPFTKQFSEEHFVIDIILQQLGDRFYKNTISTMKDIVGPVPQDAFKCVRNDYILLKSVIKDLDVNLLIKLPAKLHYDYEECISGSDESNKDDEEELQDLNNLLI
ncbi:zinc finger MYM-type protein 1-like [Aphis craccivora]|uniref:Zinc finger MYM-type protein 1-like n=1 Tax=Aphis craccivora TaxID=307492 RepID=A0A6G0VPW9_APHCR|nr:zinc finger MYM-type protein 1-like [Aphis craccivora]